MPFHSPWGARLGRVASRMHWARGTRAGLAVAVSMLACHRLAIPMGWSALGAFECVIVDNGGPYRTRFQTIAVLLLGGGFCAALASLVTTHLAATLLATALVCFAFTYLRAAGDPFTSSSVIVLVIYFIGLSHPAASLSFALYQVRLFVSGGLGAAVLCLLFWPLFPFKPARMAIARAYGILAELLAASADELEGSATLAESRRVHELQNAMRRALENARLALGSVRARSPARTIRGQNLAILLETAEVFFGRAIALHGFLGLGDPPPSAAEPPLQWMQSTAAYLQAALIGQWSSKRIGESAAPLLAAGRLQAGQQQQEWLDLFGSALRAAAASSSGIDPLLRGTAVRSVESELMHTGFRPDIRARRELLRQNWTPQSSAWRHALRSSIVCTASVLLGRLLHIEHGDWMSLTAVLVLQPWVAHTWRKSRQRVGGTIAGGILAALLAAVVHAPLLLIATVALTSFFTLALYAVDYGWYCFFLTPTFVLLAGSRSHAWDVAAIRGLDTLLGAILALAASRFLFQQAGHLELQRIFARVLTLQAAYLDRMEQYWAASASEKAGAERLVLIPGRRAVGLANNEAEESLDRLVLEFAKTKREAELVEHALAFTTYSRRLTQATTMLATQSPQPGSPQLARLQRRVQLLAELLQTPGRQAADAPHLDPDPAGAAGEARTSFLLSIERMHEQVNVLERCARELLSSD